MVTVILPANIQSRVLLSNVQVCTWYLICWFIFGLLSLLMGCESSEILNNLVSIVWFVVTSWGLSLLPGLCEDCQYEAHCRYLLLLWFLLLGRTSTAFHFLSPRFIWWCFHPSPSFVFLFFLFLRWLLIFSSSPLLSHLHRLGAVFVVLLSPPTATLTAPRLLLVIHMSSS